MKALKILSFGAALSLAVVSLAQTRADYAESQLVVKVRAEYASRAQQILQSQGGQVLRTITGTNTYVVRLPVQQSVSDAATRYGGLAAVEFAEPNYLVHATRIPNDTEYSKQYGPKLIGMEKAWDLTIGKPNAVVAICDTGVDLQHPEFQGKLLAGYDFAYNDNDPDDVHGHGTHCAGIAAATGNNGLGVAGMSWGSRILPVKVLGDTGGGSSDAVASGIRFAADRGAKVISLSLGGYGDATIMKEAVAYAFAKGAVIVGGAGNDNTSNPFYPGAYPEVINVGATTEADVKAGFSNFGDTVDVAAPGDLIYSTFPGTYGFASGTSMACPMVSGLVALVYSYGKSNLTNVEVRKAIESTCKPMPAGFVQKGRIQPYEALKKTPRTVAEIVLLSAVSKHQGGAAFGGLASAQHNDGATYSISSAQIAQTGAVAGAFLTFKLNASASSLDSVALTLRQTGALKVTNTIFVYNPTTKLYEVLKSAPMSGSEQAVTISVSNPGMYLSAAKEIKFLTRGLLPRRLQTPSASSFTLAIDEASLGLTLLR